MKKKYTVSLTWQFHVEARSPQAAQCLVNDATEKFFMKVVKLHDNPSFCYEGITSEEVEGCDATTAVTP